jgi:hypothetical protein
MTNESSSRTISTVWTKDHNNQRREVECEAYWIYIVYRPISRPHQQLHGLVISFVDQALETSNLQLQCQGSIVQRSARS